MDQDWIGFAFEEAPSARDAVDTLKELGYQVTTEEELNPVNLYLHMRHNDLTSALEIIQMHGGRMMQDEREGTLTEQLSDTTYNHFSADIRM